MTLVLVLLRRLTLVLALCTAGAVAAEVRLTLPEARGTAVRFLEAGRPDVALVLAEGVLLGAPGDHIALMLKSRALRDMGRTDEAASAARAAWQGAANDRERYFAAMVMAQARASGGQRIPAQFWLRRAANLAPEEPLRKAAIADFRHVRSTTPAKLRFDLSVTPSDNLNDAPRSEVLRWGPFTHDLSRPLSGVKLQFGADYTYRIALGQNARINLGGVYMGRRVRLSDEARALDPLARNRDFSVDVFGAILGYEKRAPDSRWIVRARLTQLRMLQNGYEDKLVGATVQRQKLQDISDVTRLDLSYGRALFAGLTGTVKLGYEVETRHDDVPRDAVTREAGIDVEKSLAAGTLRLGLSARDVESDSIIVAREQTRVELGYHHAKPIMGMIPSLTLSYEKTLFDTAWAPLWQDRREDAEWGVSADVTLPALGVYGFAPEIGVSFRDRRSNYVPYETRGTNLRLGLKSVF